MQRFALSILTTVLIGTALVFSNAKNADSGLAIQSMARNPWTHVQLNNKREEFQFAIVSDRTGGHRPQVFARAVDRLNLLQPEFVLSVGDLIEGGNKTAAQIANEWTEFDQLVNKLQMPFFYVPGNHDLGSKNTNEFWQAKFGRSHYHFVYRDVLFLCLNTDDPPGASPGRIGPEQLAFARKVLSENKDVRWTIVAMHKPIWTAGDVKATGVAELEHLLADRPYTVFAGHVHRYQKFIRNGRNYYQLATTGGSSRMRGLNYREFDHIVWVTMKPEGPVFANILLDAILPENLQPRPTDEPGVSTAGRKQTYPTRGRVFFEGAPAAQAYVVLESLPVPDKSTVRADGLVEADGAVVLSTYTAFDGVPAGDYRMTVVWRRPFLDADGRPGQNILPARYARPETSGLQVQIKPAENDFEIELHR